MNITALYPFVGIIGFIILTVAGGVYLVSQVRKTDMETLRSANTDLRSSLSDQAKKIEELSNQVVILTERVNFLEKRNKTLEDLVVTALKQYFFENPKTAGAMKDFISPQA